jgi:1-acyl-sn-glycerol-3-phosphate acyltransferase
VYALSPTWETAIVSSCIGALSQRICACLYYTTSLIYPSSSPPLLHHGSGVVDRWRLYKSTTFPPYLIGSVEMVTQDESQEVSLAQLQDEDTDRSLVEGMARFRQNPFSAANELLLFVRGVGWRSYDKVIGQPCFYNGYTDNLKQLVMKSPMLQRKLLELTERKLRGEEEEHLLDVESPMYLQDREARKTQIISGLVDITQGMLDNMICKMESKLYLRAAYYGCTQLLTRAYSAIHVSERQVKRLREVAKLAESQKRSIIFLPRHTSHIDYVSLHIVCFRLGLTVPVVVAGDNLNFPVVGSFLQSIGAMWLRRSFGDDALYPTLVQSYIDTMMQQGYNLECFIEGTRSRTGKLLGPKFGILSFYLDSILSGRVQDAWICPVSMQYDRVIEVDSFVTELLGKPKQKENLADFLSASSLLALNFGRIECRFQEPWSLRDFINEQNARIPSATSSREKRGRILRTLGYRVLSDINDVSVVMPTALVGTVLLTLRGRGVGQSELIRRVEWLCSRITAKGGQISDFQGLSTKAVVDRALEVLGPKLVGRVDGLAEETFYAVDRFQLSFYRNMTIHLFISEALVAAALYTRVKQGGGFASQSIGRTDLIENVAFLSQLWRGEFIFPAGHGFERNVEDALNGLLKEKVLTTTTAALDGSTGEVRLGLSDEERALGRENFDFYCFMIWPFIDAAWLGGVSLYCLVPPTGSAIEWVDMATAQNAAQLFGRTLYHQGDLSYFESINKEALKNAFTRYQEEGIIEVAKSTPVPATSGATGMSRATPAKSSGPVVRLAPEWRPERDSSDGAILPKGKLWDFMERIASHRREGKNRRDGATVSTRVLNLAEKLNWEIFGMTDIPPDVDDAETASETMPVSVKGRPRRRTKL